LQRAFPLDVLMIPSSVITIASNGECLTCSGFSLGEPIHLGNFEFITDYFSGLSLSPRRGDSGTRSAPWWAMIEDSIEEFLTTSSGDKGSGLPSPRRRAMGPPSAPIVTTPWPKDILDIAVAQ
jgi:hypothetical protein